MAKADRSKDPVLNSGGNSSEQSAPPVLARHVNALQLANLLGYHRNTVMGWPAKNCPVVQRADVSTNTHWIFDVSAVVKWLTDEAVSAAIAKYENEGGQVPEAVSKARKAQWAAIDQEVSTREKMHSLVPIQYVLDQMTADYAAIKNIISKIPGVIAANVEAQMAATVHRVADKLIREAMGRLEVKVVEDIEE